MCTDRCVRRAFETWSLHPERVGRRANTFEIAAILVREQWDDLDPELVFKIAIWLDQEDESMPEHPRYSGFGPERGSDERVERP